MIAEGVLKNPEPAVIVGQHVYPQLPAGKVGFRSGMYMASADEIYVTIHGKGGFVEGGALIKANMDHRIAMAFLVLGMGSDKPVEIDNAATIDTSFPAFYESMSTLGANLVRIKPEGMDCKP